MSSLWLDPKSFIRVVGRSRSPVTKGAPAKEDNLHEHLTQFAFSNPGAGELRNYLRLHHLCKRGPSSRSDCAQSRLECLLPSNQILAAGFSARFDRQGNAGHPEISERTRN